jgi:hypothetical protein
LEANEIISAIADFSESLQILPSIMAYVHRGVGNYRLQNYYEAIHDYDEAIKLDPSISLTYLNRGSAKLDLTHYGAAIDDYDTVIAMDSQDVRAYTGRAMAKFGLSRIGDAFEDCIVALKMQSDIAWVYYSIGKLYFRNREIEKAIYCARIATTIEESDPSYLFRVANYYAEWKEYNVVEDEFYDVLGKYGQQPMRLFINKSSFMEKERLARTFYSLSFTKLMPLMRSDLDESEAIENIFLFIGNSDHIFDPLEKKSFFFADVRTFSDKTDCPLLHPINQAVSATKFTFDNVRIRCLCKLKSNHSIESHRSMWDRYANAHTGVAYKLKICKNWLEDNSLYTNQVSYEESEIIIGAESPEQVIEDGLYKKYIGYKDESEWRIVKFGEFQCMEGIEIPWNYNGLIGVTIEAIFIGLDAPKDVKSRIICKATEEGIPIYEIIMDKSGTLESKLVANPL